MSELDWLEVVNDSSEDGRRDESWRGSTDVFEVTEEAHDLLLGAGLVEGELHILSGAVGGEVSVEVDVDLLALDDLATIIWCISTLRAFLAALIEDRNPGLRWVLVQDAVVSGQVAEAADGSLGRVEIAGQEGGGVDGVGCDLGGVNFGLGAQAIPASGLLANAETENKVLVKVGGLAIKLEVTVDLLGTGVVGVVGEEGKTGLGIVDKLGLLGVGLAGTVTGASGNGDSGEDSSRESLEHFGKILFYSCRLTRPILKSKLLLRRIQS